MGVIHLTSVSEYILLQETTKLNIYSLEVSEQMSMAEALTHQYHDATVRESLYIIEKVVPGLSITLGVSETLSIAESAYPRVFVENIAEAIGFSETLNDQVISEALSLNESASYGLAKGVYEALNAVEDASYKLIKLILISEILDPQEGLSVYKMPLTGDTLPFIPATCYEPLELEPASYTPVEETPTGVINGSNKNYGITYPPVSDWLQVFYNGLLQRQGSDYTLSGTTIIFVDAPLPGSTLKVNYFK